MKKYAIFFPQFHRAKVNDQAWGCGFTDWALVASANAFSYWNKRAPAAGFYDLADENVVQKQFDEAAQAGLDGFGIYHYYFDYGSELGAVEKALPHIEIRADFQYFFIWANENWSKRWAGKDTELLASVPTRPSPQHIRDHVAYLAPFMRSPNYTQWNGSPMFAIYRPDFFADPAATVAAYRAEFARIGIVPAIGYFLKSAAEVDHAALFDFCYLFEPRLFQNFSGLRKNRYLHLIAGKLVHLLPYSWLEYLSQKVANLLRFRSRSHSTPFARFRSYFSSAERKQLVSDIDCPVQNVLSCGWNNAPRYRDRFTAVETPTPKEFSQLVQGAVANTGMNASLPMLCNAWNEWSEGAALEPCAYLGDTLLQAYLNMPAN